MVMAKNMLYAHRQKMIKKELMKLLQSEEEKLCNMEMKIVNSYSLIQILLILRTIHN